VPEVRCEPLAAEQLAAMMIEAIETIEDAGAEVVEVEMGPAVGKGAAAGIEPAERQASIPVRKLRSFIAESLKAQELTLGRDDLSLECAEAALSLRFCAEAHVHFSSADGQLVERTVVRWRASGYKVFEQRGSDWVPRI